MPAAAVGLAKDHDYYIHVKLIEVTERMADGKPWDRADGSGPDLRFSLTWRRNVIWKSIEKPDTLIGSWDLMKVDLRQMMITGGGTDIEGLINAPLIHYTPGEAVALKVWDEDTIGSDHAGFTYKEAIRAMLTADGHIVQDFGTYSDAPCDYPDFVRPVALAGVMGGEGSNWVAIMEKAFTFFRRNEGTYSSISNGWMSEAFLGLGSSTFSETADGSNILNWLRNELNAGKAVTFATKGTVPVGCPCVGSHAYMVERVNTVTIALPFGGSVTIPVSVTLRNPWGYDGAGSDSDTSDGYVTLTGEQAAGVLWKAQSAFV